MPDVLINFATQGEANVVRAWAAQSLAIKEHNKHLGDAYTAAQRADGGMSRFAAGMKRDLTGIGSSIKNITLGIVGGGGILAAYKLWSDATKQLQQQSHDLGINLSEMRAKAAIQLGLTQTQEMKFENQIFDTAFNRATPVDVTYGTATQLGSSGVKKEDVPEALDTVLSIRNAMSSFGKSSAEEINPKDLTLALSGYLKSQGLELNAANLGQVGTMMGSLYKNTDLQLGDLLELAPQGSAIKSGMTMQEQLATASLLKDIGNSPEEMAVKMRQVVIEGGTTAGSKSSIDAMGEVGLKPEDVDMVGESFTESIKRWNTAFAGVDQAKKQTVLSKVFGSRQVAPMLNMMENIDKIEERVAQMSDPANAGIFAADRQRAETGAHAVAQRQEVSKQRLLRDSGAGDVVMLRKQLEIMALEAGLSAGAAAARVKAFDEQAAMPGIDKFAAFDVAGMGLVGPGMRPSQAAFAALKQQGYDRQLPVKRDVEERHGDLDLSPRERLEKARKAVKQAEAEVSRHRAGVFDPRTWGDSPEEARTRLTSAKRERSRAAEVFTNSFAGGDNQATKVVTDLIDALRQNTAATVGNTQGQGPLNRFAGGRYGDPAPEEPNSVALASP